MISLAEENAKELRVAIAQDDLSVFVRQIGRPVRVYMPGYPYLTATLSAVIPRALRQPTHPALTALNGGPLPVQPSAAPGSSTKGETFELLAPRFTGIVCCNPGIGPELHAGQVGMISCRTRNESIAVRITNLVSQWVRERCRTPLD